MECILTIEIGTSAVKATAFKLDGQVIATQKGTYPTFHPRPDYSEQDPEQIFVTFLNVVRSLVSEKIRPRKYKVAAIAFSAAMHSLLPVDKKGIPLSNVMIWSDNRAKEEADILKSSPEGKNIYRATGTPVHPMSPLTKITWIRNHNPETFDRAEKFISVKEYVLFQLTGSYFIDHSLASATGLFNNTGLKWEDKALDFAGINESRLSYPVPVNFSELKIRKEFRDIFGISTNTKVLIGASDGCLATLGAGGQGEGKATVTLDTTGAVRLIGRQQLYDTRQRFFNYLLADGYFVSGGPTNNGGAVFEWYCRQFARYTNFPDFDDAFSKMFVEAAQVQPGAGGLVFLPYLLGERAPLWNADARGSYFGININHRRKHFVRATVEGVIYELYSIAKTLQEHRQISEIHLNGPLAILPFLSQLIADVFNMPAHVNSNTDSSARGLYLLSATELGLYTSLEEGARAETTFTTFLPRPDEHEVYMKHYEIFERLSTKLSDEFELISKLQMA